jgi:hypothetical protein
MYSRPETETESYRPEAETYCKKAGGEGWGGDGRMLETKIYRPETKTDRPETGTISQNQRYSIKTRDRENERKYTYSPKCLRAKKQRQYYSRL